MRKNPALHLQAKDDVLATGEVDCAGQGWHEPEPVWNLNVPAGHAVQGPPLGPVYPELQGVWECVLDGMLRMNTAPIKTVVRCIFDVSLCYIPY